TDLPQSSQTPDLKTAGISQQRTFPADETVQAAGSFDHLDSRSQPEMVRIAKNYFRVELGGLEFLKTNALDRVRRADRHEHRRFDWAAPCIQNPRTRFALLSLDIKP